MKLYAKHSEAASIPFIKKFGSLFSWLDTNRDKLEDIAESSDLGKDIRVIFNNLASNKPSVLLLGDRGLIEVELDKKTGDLGNFIRSSMVHKL